MCSQLLTAWESPFSTARGFPLEYKRCNSHSCHSPSLTVLRDIPWLDYLRCDKYIPVFSWPLLRYFGSFPSSFIYDSWMPECIYITKQWSNFRPNSLHNVADTCHFSLTPRKKSPTFHISGNPDCRVGNPQPVEIPVWPSLSLRLQQNLESFGLNKSTHTTSRLWVIGQLTIQQNMTFCNISDDYKMRHVKASIQITRRVQSNIISTSCTHNQ